LRVRRLPGIIAEWRIRKPRSWSGDAVDVRAAVYEIHDAIPEGTTMKKRRKRTPEEHRPA
jgi:hypothetical protein